MPSLCPREALSGLNGELDVCEFDLNGDWPVADVMGGLRTTLPLPLWSGRRGGFAAKGIGAWLIMGAAAGSKKLSWKI